MLNRCEFIGNMGVDPEVKTFQSGDKIANIRIAVTEKWKDKATGERRERTEWVSGVVRGGLVGVVEQYTRKGSKVFIAGKMATRKWQDRDGHDKYSTEIMVNELTLLDGKPKDGASGDGWGGEYGHTKPQSEQGERAPADDFDDEIPGWSD